MKKAKTLRSVGAILLTMALLAGMLSVVGVMPAAANTETPSVFEADFSEAGNDISAKAAEKYLEGKFKLYYNREAEFAELPMPHITSTVLDAADTANRNAYLSLADGYLNATFALAAEVHRKSFSLVPKIANGGEALVKNFETAFDMTVPADTMKGTTQCYGAISLNFRSAAAGKISGGASKANLYADKVSLYFTQTGFALYDGASASYFTVTGDENFTAWNDGATVVNAHVYVKVVGATVTLKVTGEGGVVYYDSTAEGCALPALTNRLDAGYMYYSIMSWAGGLANISAKRLDDNGDVIDWNAQTQSFKASWNGSGNITAAYVMSTKEKFNAYYNRDGLLTDSAFSNFSTQMPSWRSLVANGGLQCVFWPATTYSNERLQAVGTLVPKLANGKEAVLKNFELSFATRWTDGRSKGYDNVSAVIGFRQQTASLFTTAAGVVNKEQGLIVISPKGISIAGGNDITDALYSTDQTVFETELNGLEGTAYNGNYHTVTVRVVGSAVTVTIDGEQQYTGTANYDKFGYLSLGASGCSMQFNNITITRLDDNGNALDWNDESATIAPSRVFYSAESLLGFDTTVNDKYASNGVSVGYTNTSITTPQRTEFLSAINDAFDLYYNDYDGTTATYMQQRLSVNNTAGYNYNILNRPNNAQYRKVYLQAAAANASVSCQIAGDHMRNIGSLVFKDGDGEQLNLKNLQIKAHTFLHSATDGGMFAIGLRMAQPGRYVKADGTAATATYVKVTQSGVSVFENGVQVGETKAFPAAMTGKELSVVVKVVGKELTYTVGRINASGATTDTSITDTVTDTVTLSTEATGFVALSHSQWRYYIGMSTLQVTALDDEGNEAPIKTIEPPAHTCDFATPKYDATGHWNECECGEKDEVLPHELSYVVDGDKHYQECACGYETDKVDHDYVDNKCACGDQEANSAVVEGNIITVKADEGYQLKAGTLIAYDKDGNPLFVPERLGFREGGDGTQYKVPEAFVGTDFTVEHEFYQPGEENGLNMGVVGTSTTEHEGGGLRFIHRLNITKEGDKLYMLKDGEKVEVAEYGLLLAAQVVLKNPEDLDIETAEDSMHVQQYAWPEKNVYYDSCSDYVDIAVHITNIVANNGGDVGIITRTYVKLADNSVYYGDVIVSSYNDAK